MFGGVFYSYEQFSFLHFRRLLFIVPKEKTYCYLKAHQLHIAPLLKTVATLKEAAMTVITAANPEQLAIRTERTIPRLILNVLRLVIFFIARKLADMVVDTFKMATKLAKAIVTTSIIVLLLGVVFIFVNQHLTSYSITYENSAYKHEDKRTTDILNYLTGQGPLPESERLTLYRQYVKNVLEDAEMDVPENIATLGKQELDQLTIAWYLENTPTAPKDPESLREIVNNLFETAVRPPLEGFGPEVNSRIWKLMQSVGSPKVRWVEIQDEAASRLVAYSAGEKRAFYDPVNNTIFLRYGDSVNVLLNEVPHALQFEEKPYSSYFRFFSGMSSSILIAIKNEAQQVYQTRYSDPESFEGEAHGPIKSSLLARFGLQSVDDNVAEKPDPQHVCVVQNPLIE